jgi:hypothetical protein
MLLALGLVPQTGLFYDALPAMLVARVRVEALALAVLSHLAWYVSGLVTPQNGFAAMTWPAGTVTLWCMLIPAMFLVLRRGRDS